jgi:hypothetical protein
VTEVVLPDAGGGAAAPYAWPVTTERSGVVRTTTRGPDFTFYIVVVVALVVLAALYPVARLVDAHYDRQRPLYEDIAEMAWLQYLYYSAEGKAYPTEVSGGQSVTIGDQTFAVNPGVELKVIATPDGWCISGHDDLGNESGDFCYPGDENPGDPS